MPTIADTVAAAEPTNARGPSAPAVVRPGGDRGQFTDRTVIVLVMLSIAALVPGVVLRLGLSTGITQVDAMIAPLRSALADIRFGSGLRFWLGAAGATMMGLMLLYPLRKVLAGGRLLGPIRHWFRIHIILGLLGPVAILYHSNFSHGGSNANVALWTMLAVAVSGIIGHFVYARASANFYSVRDRAGERLEAICATLDALDAMHGSRVRLLEGLKQLEAALLTPRQGVAASLSARLRLERRRHRLARELGWHLAECARVLGLSASEHERLRILVGSNLAAFVRIARVASSRSVREQLWARWRLFHLPVFLMMTVAATLHVVAVWGVDDWTADNTSTTAAGIAITPAAPAEQAPSPKQSASQQSLPGTRKVATVAIQPAPPPALVAPPQPAPRRTSGAGVAAGGSSVVGDITRSTAPPVDTRSGKEPAPEPPQKTVSSVPPPAQKPPGKPPAEAGSGTDQIAAVYAQLSRRIEEQPMKLGGTWPRTLAEQIVELKTRQKAGTFSHSEAETGFALTGRHLKVDCVSCHTKPLREARQSNPRQCIACHKDDDIHRGRRPDCAKCHTTNRWSEIIRRR